MKPLNPMLSQELQILGLAQGLTTRILGQYLELVREPENKRGFTDEELNF